MSVILNIYKPQGMTPLDVIKQVRKNMPEYKHEIIGFAGRLDPLAHGVLLLMIGEKPNKEREKYLNLPKEYEFEVVFGMATDTYDALGMLLSSRATGRSRGISYHKIRRSLHSSADSVEMTKKIKEFITSKLGKQTQIYPPFSSKTVNGKPLFWWTKENKLSEIIIPEREIEIYDFKLLEINQISQTKLKEEIMKQINLVQGDFRQEKIKEKWEEFFIKTPHPVIPAKAGIQKKLDSRLHGNDKHTFTTAKFSILCSSGTYIRSLTNELGEKLGSGAITIDIKRTKVAENLLKNSLILQK